MTNLIEIAETWIDQDNIDSIDFAQDKETLKWVVRVYRKKGYSVFCGRQFETKKDAMDHVRETFTPSLGSN